MRLHEKTQDDGAEGATARALSARLAPDLAQSSDLAQISVVMTGVPLDAVSSVGGSPAVSACSSSTYAAASPKPPLTGGSGGSSMHTSRALLDCARTAALTARAATSAPADVSQDHQAADAKDLMRHRRSR